jgi:ABC-type Fe2+-enterobactin transport system substrate-binding protein
MASNTVSSTRKQLENAVDTILADMGTRSSQELGNQLDEACGRLKIVQKGIEASVNESLKIQVGETLKSFEHSMEELAQQAVGRLRLTLANGLNSLVLSLGEQFRTDGASNGESKHPRID